MTVPEPLPPAPCVPADPVDPVAPLPPFVEILVPPQLLHALLLQTCAAGPRLPPPPNGRPDPSPPNMSPPSLLLL
jgi:hypothetical protein